MFQAGWHEQNRFTHRSTLRARELYARAVEGEAKLAEAHALLGATYSTEHMLGWRDDPGLLDRARRCVRRAVYDARWTWTQCAGGRPDEAVAIWEALRADNGPEADPQKLARHGAALRDDQSLVQALRVQAPPSSAGLRSQPRRARRERRQG